MDTTRQILRYSIPGAIALILAVFFVTVTQLLTGTDLSSIMESLRENGSAVLAIVAVVPLGFFLYQVYHLTYRPFVFPWLKVKDTRWVRVDRGATVLDSLPELQIEKMKAIFGLAQLDTKDATMRATGWGRIGKAQVLSEDYRKGCDAVKRYSTRWRTNWQVLRVLIEVADGSGKAGSLKDEYVVLSDIYHALGACRTGVQLAWLTSVAAVFVTFDSGAADGAVLALLLNLFLGFCCFWTFHRARGRTWISAEACLRFGLAAYFARNPRALDPESE